MEFAVYHNFDIEAFGIFRTEQNHYKWYRDNRGVDRVRVYSNVAEHQFIEEMIVHVKNWIVLNSTPFKKYSLEQKEERIKEYLGIVLEREEKRTFPEPFYFFTENQDFYRFDNPNYHYLVTKEKKREYELFFAIKLRQLEPSDILSFLDYHKNKYGEGFLDFVENIGLKYKGSLLVEGRINYIDKWLTEQKQERNPKKQNIIQGFNFLPISNENQFVEVYVGKHTDKQLLEFMKFFYLEKIDGDTFLSEEETKELFKYRLAIPEKERDNMVTLNVNNEKRYLGLITEVFWHFGKKYSTKVDRKPLAKFLYYSIKNYNEKYPNAEALRKVIRDRGRHEIKRRIQPYFDLSIPK